MIEQKFKKYFHFPPPPQIIPQKEKKIFSKISFFFKTKQQLEISKMILFAIKQRKKI